LEYETTAKGYLRGGIVRPNEDQGELRLQNWKMGQALLCEQRAQNPGEKEMNWPRGRDLYCFRYVKLFFLIAEIYAPLGIWYLLILLHEYVNPETGEIWTISWKPPKQILLNL
jgi:hypothetical protein